MQFLKVKLSQSFFDKIILFFLGLVHDDLRTFLDTNLPKEKKRAKMILGVADSRLASSINELFSITCQHTGVVPELLRGKN
jgi:nucleolar protein 56